jgi:hypothetical protein
VIDLRDIEAVAPLKRKKRTNVFGIVTSEKKFYLQAGSPEELLEWTNVIRNACRKARATAAIRANRAADEGEGRRNSQTHRSVASITSVPRSSQESGYTTGDERSVSQADAATDAVHHDQRTGSVMSRTSVAETTNNGPVVSSAILAGQAGRILQGHLIKRSQKSKASMNGFNCLYRFTYHFILVMAKTLVCITKWSFYLL